MLAQFTDFFFRGLAYRHGREGFQQSIASRLLASRDNLDVNTLFPVTIYGSNPRIAAVFAWAQNAPITAVAWWGFAHLLRAASVTLFSSAARSPI